MAVQIEETWRAPLIPPACAVGLLHAMGCLGAPWRRPLGPGGLGTRPDPWRRVYGAAGAAVTALNEVASSEVLREADLELVEMNARYESTEERG